MSKSFFFEYGIAVQKPVLAQNHQADNDTYALSDPYSGDVNVSLRRRRYCRRTHRGSAPPQGTANVKRNHPTDKTAPVGAATSYTFGEIDQLIFARL